MEDIRIEIAERLSMATCRQLVEVQRSAWQLADLDILPAWKLFVTPTIGSHIIVAYAGNTAVAFGLFSHAHDPQQPAQPYLYLDMLGVSRPYQGQQLGFQIMQKAQALARAQHYAYIAWTYDPLEGANANLYIKKLGAVATKYYEDYYGPLTGERHTGTATDRFWTVLQPHAAPTILAPQIIITESMYDAADALIQKATGPIGIAIPKDCIAIRDHNPARAHHIRLATRRIFQHLFAQRYTMQGFVSEPTQGVYVAVQ